MSGNKHFKLIYIYIVAFVFCAFLIIHNGCQYFPDTYSYIIAWNHIVDGQIDKWRTPVYPLFLGSLRSLLGQDNYPICAIIIQFFVFLVSIRYFNKLAIILLQSESISYWLTAFYALYPCIPSLNCFLITEPFAIYGIVFLLYSTIHAIKTDSPRYILYTTLWLFFLVFLRPALIYLIPVYIVGWLLLCVVNKKAIQITFMHLGGTIFVGLSVLVYSYCFERNYGMFTPSGIGVINQYYIARTDGILDPLKTNNPCLKEYVEKSISVHGTSYTKGSSYDVYSEAENAIDLYGLADVSHLVTLSVMSDKTIYFKRILLHIHRTATDKLFDSLLPKFRTIIDIIGIRINFVYILLLLYPLMWFLLYRKKKYFPVFSFILYMMGASHLIVIIVGCQNEWFRLILPVVPCYILMFGQILSVFNISINIRNILL